MIQIHHASLKYDHRGIAGLSDITLEVKTGEIVSVLGPNGCGKSTLLNLIAGKIKPVTGTVQCSGKLHQFILRDIPSDMNVQKYLVSQVDPSIDDEKKIQLTRDFADIFEFTFQLRQNAGQLSQGQRQKVMLTAELINHPDVLLLDEPFVHLDPYTRKDILDALFTYVKNRGMTILWVTHDQEDAMKFSNRMIVMQHGKFEQVGTPEAFLRPRNLFVALFLGQKNFLPIKKFGDSWRTPWGSLHDHFVEHEAILVIPPDAWVVDDKSPTRFKVISSTVQPFYWEITLEWEEKNYVLRLKHPPQTPFINIRPMLDQCFLIPL